MPIFGGGSDKIEIPIRNPGKEFRQLTNAQIDLFPRILGAEQTFRPQLAQLEVDILRDTLLGKDGLLSLQQETIPQLESIREQQVLSDLGLLERFGDQARSLVNPGRTELIDILQGQASDELALNGELSPQDIRDVQQSTRSAFQSQGIGNSNPALFTEVLGRDAFKRNRQDRARQFGFNAANLRDSFIDPFAFVLRGQTSPQSAISQASFGINAQPTIINPLDPAGLSILNSNHDANVFNALNGGGGSNTGQVIGSILGGAGAGFFGLPPSVGAGAGGLIGGLFD